MKRLPIIWFSLTFLFLSFLLLCGPKISAAELPKDQLGIFLRRGVEKAFNLDEKGAAAELKKATELDPENPIGFSFLALSHLFFFETSFDEKEKKVTETALLQAAEDSRIRAGKRIEKNPRDGGAYFALALEEMIKDRWDLVCRKYFQAFRDAQQVWYYLEKTRDLDPENYDIYYPMGTIHYYLAQLSGTARAAASLLITPADREKGLKELEIAAEKGDFLKDAAVSTLVLIYNSYEKKPDRALPLAMRLHKKYPDNYNYSFAIGDILSSLGRSDEAFLWAREIEKRIKTGISPYGSELWPRYHQLLGKIYLDEGDYKKAEENFKLVLKDTSPLNTRVRAWALVRLGMIEDVRADRKLAQEYYRKALKVEESEGAAKHVAKEYLNTPYSPPNTKEKTLRPAS